MDRGRGAGRRREEDGAGTKAHPFQGDPEERAGGDGLVEEEDGLVDVLWTGGVVVELEEAEGGARPVEDEAGEEGEEGGARKGGGTKDGQGGREAVRTGGGRGLGHSSFHHLSFLPS